MPDEKPAPPAEKKKSPIMLFGVVGALMVAEAVGVYILVGMTSAPATQAAQVELLPGELDDAEKVIEVELVNESYHNRSTGRPYLWQTEIVLQVRQKNVEWVNALIGQRKAEIRENIAKIIGGALDRHLSEPGRQTIDRQITSYVNGMFGTDGTGADRVHDVLIPTLHGNLADF